MAQVGQGLAYSPDLTHLKARYEEGELESTGFTKLG